MKLTPLDIHHKEFHHALRGYSEEEVDTFLDEVAEEFERLFKENIDLSEKLEATSAKVRDYQSMEVTLNNTMVSAQRSAEQIVAQANEDASAMLRDAEVKAKEIIHSALTDRQKAQGDLVRITQAEEGFRAQFQGLLESYLADISAVPLSSEMTAVAQEAEEALVGDVDIELPAGEAPSDAADAQEEIAALVEAPEAALPAKIDSETDDTADDETRSMAEPAVAAAAAVESMSFGELDGPDLLGEDFGEPKEFAMPSLETFGERDDDTDIEEID